MTDEEKVMQRALGLEKGFVVDAVIEVPVYVSIPIIVKEFTEEGVREVMHALTDEQKRKLIHQVCTAIIAEERYSDRESLQDIGEEARDDIGIMSRSTIRNLDPKVLFVDCIDIEKENIVGGDTVEDAKKYLQEERCVEEEHIIIINEKE